ncbi:LOW QUALITY PROTEIN: Uncharacterized protein PHPALM_2852 [Phytophthora palmivora]|uniref:Retrovirus-related Pol polyprotein from transposon TNT 1-94-like beta-barrel domain-containing protein n=1 Tax=Phytophthora palmivora TaxID=4796 RepID=A0A2P4YNT5_9STRA|nr:LOW QUALITY PROTEIN: Uncharacterized protein PHPALM_2852 [Phytophthora palmivora]
MPAILISTLPESYDNVVETFLASHVPTTVNEPPNYEQLEHALEMAYDRRQGLKLDGKSEEQALYDRAEVEAEVVVAVEVAEVVVAVMVEIKDAVAEEVAEVVEVQEEEEVEDVVVDHVFTVKNKDIKFVIVRKRPPSESSEPAHKQTKTSGNAEGKKPGKRKYSNYAAEDSEEDAYIISALVKQPSRIQKLAHGRWYLDSGATCHMTNQKIDFVSFTEMSALVRVGGENWLNVVGVGTVKKEIQTTNGRRTVVLRGSVLQNVTGLSVNMCTRTSGVHIQLNHTLEVAISSCLWMK